MRKLLRRRGDEQPPALAVRSDQDVTVWIRGLGRTAGKVVATAENCAHIRLAVDPRFGDATITDGDAALEHVAARGLYRQTGRVRFAEGAVSFTPSEGAELVQRRDYVRLPMDLSVTAQMASHHGELDLRVLDLSASGLLVARTAEAPLDEGTTVWLSIPLDDGLPPITPRGAVVRGAETDTRGVRFDFITDSDQERLVRFVLRGQLRLRREGKL